MGRKKITDEEIRKGIKEGLTDKEIAEEHNVTYPTVVRRRNKLGLDPNPPESRLHEVDATEEEIAYLAGIADGEGSFMIKKSTYGERKRDDVRSPTYSERFTIKMKRREAISLLEDIFGGSTWKYRDLYCYEATDKMAATLTKALLPYLRIKREQAKLLMKLRKDKAKGRGRFRGGPSGRSMPEEALNLRERLYKEVKKLNEHSTK